MLLGVAVVVGVTLLELLVAVMGDAAVMRWCHDGSWLIGVHGMLYE